MNYFEELDTSKSNKELKFVIIGGGVAGLFTALFLKHFFPNSKVRIVYSKNIGTIGVGESSTPLLVEHFLMFGMKLNDFKQTNATAKLAGVFNNGFSKQNDYFVEPFILPNDAYGFKNNTYDFNFIEYFIHASKKSNFNVHKFTEIISPFTNICKNGVNISKFKNLNFDYNKIPCGLHFDAHLIIDLLEKFCKKKRIEFIDDAIEDCNIVEDKITEIKCKHNIIKYFDYVIDCSGLSRLTLKYTKNKFISESDIFINSAIPNLVKEDVFYPFTKATGYDHGWYFNIPLTNRTGCGFLFNDNITPENTLHLYMDNFFKNNKKLNFIKRNKVLKWIPGYVEKPFLGNVFCSGISCFFFEPLAASTFPSLIFNLYHFKNFINEKLVDINSAIHSDIKKLKYLNVYRYSKPKDAPMNSIFWNEYYEYISKLDYITHINDSISNLDINSIQSFISREASFALFLTSFLAKQNVIQKQIKINPATKLMYNHVLKINNQFYTECIK